jgi:AcrR family transcriptional regulator
MEPIPARLLRPQAERCKSRPPKTPRDRQTYDYILEAAEDMFLTHGRLRVTIPALALATELSQLTIRRKILDLDNLLRIILTKHLNTIVKRISEVPADSPDLRRLRRAAYYRATRAYRSVPTQMHFLLLQERFSLPPDQREPIESLRAMIGGMLGGDDWEATLHELDCPTTDLDTAEAVLATRAEHLRQRAETPKPAPDPTPVASAPEPPRPTQITTFPAIEKADFASPLSNLPDAALRALNPTGRKPKPEPPRPKSALLATAARAGP